MVDEFVPTLKSAIDGLVPKKGDFTKINDLMKLIPEDMSVYTDSSAATLASAITEAKTAMEEEWNRLQQDEIDAIAASLEDAIENLEYKGADYSKVDEAIEKANALNKDDYKDFSKVEAAINAVDRSKNITEQAEVDAMAEAIENAIKGLEKKESSTPTKPTEPPKDKTETDSPQTGDNSNLMLWITLMGASAAGLSGVLLQKHRRSKVK